MPYELMKGQAPPKSLDVPYTRAIRWKDWEERYGVPPPYASPTQEYLENIHYPTQGGLLFRWHDMGDDKPVEIWRLFNERKWARKREATQRILRQAEPSIDPSDPLVALEFTVERLGQVREHIAKLNQELDQGFEEKVEVSGSMVTGFEREIVVRPLDSASQRRKEESLLKFMEMEQMLMGKATSRVEVGDAGDAYRKTILQSMITGNYTVNGVSMKAIQEAKVVGELPEPSPEESEVVFHERDGAGIFARKRLN